MQKLAPVVHESRHGEETSGGGSNGFVMPDLTAKRTLVKSPPELWEELSEVDRLARHLEAFGEITITKLEPEHTVAWEGERASGTVSIEPSGWGTKVTLTAELTETAEPAPAPGEPEPVAAEPDPEPPAAEPEPDAPEPVAEVADAPRRGFWGWLFRVRTDAQAPLPQPEPKKAAAITAAVDVGEEGPPEPTPTPEPVAATPEPTPLATAQAILEDTLESLGSAHHRPFSRG